MSVFMLSDNKLLNSCQMVQYAHVRDDEGFFDKSSHLVCKTAI